MNVRRFLGLSLGVVLAVAVGLVVFCATRPLERTFAGTLKELLPQARDVPGWTVDYRPVGETAEMQKTTAEVLNFDGAVYAIYTRGEMRISVYAAYWLPGKMSSRLIAGHAPDVCWVGAGWVPLKAEQTVNSRTMDSRTVETVHALVMEHRVFQLDELTEHVVYSHIVGGRVLHYGGRGTPPWYTFLQDIVARGFRQREEQFFLRISSNRPLAEFKDTEPVTILLGRFQKTLKL